MLTQGFKKEESLDLLIKKLNNTFKKQVDIKIFQQANQINEKKALIDTLLLYFFFQQYQRDAFNYSRYLYGNALNFHLKFRKTPKSLRQSELNEYKSFLKSLNEYIKDFTSKCNEFDHSLNWIVDCAILEKCLDSVEYSIQENTLEELVKNKKHFEDYTWIGNLSISDAVCFFKSLDIQKNEFIKTIIIKNKLNRNKMTFSHLEKNKDNFLNIINEYKEKSSEDIDY